MAFNKFLFGISGLLIGLVIGFTFANSVNRSGSETSVSSGETDLSANVSLPADHPPVGIGSRNQTEGGALPQVTEAIERAKNDPKNFEAQMTAGDLYYQIQRFSDAAKFYENANRIKPDELEPMVKLGNAYFDSEQYETAEKWYLNALKKTPNDTNIRTDLGLTYYLRTPRSNSKAIKEFQAVLAIEPNKEIALQNLALAFRENGDNESYERTFEKLKSVNPDNPFVTGSVNR